MQWLKLLDNKKVDEYSCTIKIDDLLFLHNYDFELKYQLINSLYPS